MVPCSGQKRISPTDHLCPLSSLPLDANPNPTHLLSSYIFILSGHALFPTYLLQLSASALVFFNFSGTHTGVSSHHLSFSTTALWHNPGRRLLWDKSKGGTDHVSQKRLNGWNSSPLSARTPQSRYGSGRMPHQQNREL